jgi:hypothetical protein
MIRKIEIERFSLTTSKAFNEVIAGVNAAIGHPDLAEFGRSTHEARCFAELKSAVEKGLSKAGLMLFMQLDQGAVLQKQFVAAPPRNWGELGTPGRSVRLSTLGLRRDPHGSVKQMHHEELEDAEKERPNAFPKIMLKQTDSRIQ